MSSPRLMNVLKCLGILALVQNSLSTSPLTFVINGGSSGHEDTGHSHVIGGQQHVVANTIGHSHGQVGTVHSHVSGGHQHGGTNTVGHSHGQVGTVHSHVSGGHQHGGGNTISHSHGSSGSTSSVPGQSWVALDNGQGGWGWGWDHEDTGGVKGQIAVGGVQNIINQALEQLDHDRDGGHSHHLGGGSQSHGSHGVVFQEISQGHGGHGHGVHGTVVQGISQAHIGHVHGVHGTVIPVVSQGHGSHGYEGHGHGDHGMAVLEGSHGHGSSSGGGSNHVTLIVNQPEGGNSGHSNEDHSHSQGILNHVHIQDRGQIHRPSHGHNLILESHIVNPSFGHGQSLTHGSHSNINPSHVFSTGNQGIQLALIQDKPRRQYPHVGVVNNDHSQPYGSVLKAFNALGSNIKQFASNIGNMPGGSGYHTHRPHGHGYVGGYVLGHHH